MRLPHLSMASKLYAIFVLLATMTVALAAAAVLNARHHAVLTAQLEAAFVNANDIEHVNGLLYGVEMEMRGIFLALDRDTANKRADDMARMLDQIDASVKMWQLRMAGPGNANVGNLLPRIAEYQEFAQDLARYTKEAGAGAARAWAETSENQTLRLSLKHEMERLAAFYTESTREIDAGIRASIAYTNTLVTAFGVFAVALAVMGVLLIWRAVARPLTAITRITEMVAEGAHNLEVPYGRRRDEVGALARSIAVFQHAMRHNEELNQTVTAEVKARAERAELTSHEIARFSAEVEAKLAALGRLSERMVEASGTLAGAADEAADKTANAASASAEASENVRDIATAASELSASVNEIDRQVAQSTAISERAATDAERTNVAVKELDDAAGRIGDVIRLINDIAEQTNLLALNATIEAARAGETGRGFAIVAGEVKALSEQTARATDEISAQITNMQRATVRSIEAITAIESTIREITDISGAIACAVDQQGAATQEIARSVEVAARRTVETANEVSRVGTAASDTRASAKTVKAVADELEHVADSIRTQVDQFFQRLSA
jgi:methyl-accepting chemotaxis protein